MVRQKLLINLLMLCMTAMDAIQIQVNHSQPVEQPEGGYFVKSSSDSYDSAMTLLSGVLQLAEPEHETERRKLFNTISETKAFKIMDSMTTKYLMGADADQIMQVRVQPMSCNITELELLFRMLSSGVQLVKSQKAPVPEKEQMPDSTIPATVGGTPKFADVHELWSTLRPEVQTACSAQMLTFKGPNWENLAGCLAAVTQTRGQCSKCFTSTFQKVIGASVFEMPFSCSAKCIADKNGPSKTSGPECNACMHSGLSDMMTCIGVDMYALEPGGKPFSGQASSLVPHQKITALVTLVTLGLTGMF